MQPIAAEDVADALVDIALAAPVNGMVEVAGPEALPLDEAIRRYLRANKDERQVVTDIQAAYYGLQVTDQSLTPGDSPRLAPTRFDTWLQQSTASGSTGATTAG